MGGLAMQYAGVMFYHPLRRKHALADWYGTRHLMQPRAFIRYDGIGQQPF
jgi:hypothetical protein